MKKIISLVLVAVMLVICLASCNEKVTGVKVIDIKLTDEEYAFAVQKGDTELLSSLNEFMAEIKANGKFDEIINKYFQGGTPTAVKSAATMKNDGSQLIVATNAAFEPFEYMEGENYYGVDMEIMALFENVQIASGAISYIVKLVNDIYNIINYSGVQMLIFLAGLQAISPSIYEACQIEGATGWETFWKITFPMISPMILVNAVYTIIDSFTRNNNPVMSYINSYSGSEEVSLAMSWMYFLIVMLIIGVVAAIASSFVFYQRRD